MNDIKNFKLLKTEKDFHAFLNFFNNKNELYLFRGQGNTEWKLNSSWLRANGSKNIRLNSGMLREHIYTFNDYVSTIKKTNNKYANMTILDILASLQHAKDVPTPLIDFTEDLLLAVFFAVYDNDWWEKNPALFIVKSDANNIKKNTDKFDVKSVDDIYISPFVSPRAIMQRSYFLVDHKNWKEDDRITKVEIEKSLIKYIKKFLINKNKSYTSLYPDLKGEYLNAMESLPITHFIKGNSKRNIIDFDKAIAHYDQAFKLDKNVSSVFLNRGFCYLQKFLKDYDEKNLDQAIKDFDEAIRLNPHQHLFFRNRGVAHLYKKNLSKALEDFDQAIAIDGNNAWDYLFKGIIYGVRKNSEEEKKNFDHAKSINSEMENKIPESQKEIGEIWEEIKK